jgi:glycosidase
MLTKWWKEAVVYQIYPKSFKDSNGDGFGDLNGITEKLDYIKDLGADVIWLCPINCSPMLDHGYDISDYYHIDPIFGSDDDYIRLIREAKSKGIKVLMDLVVNHCSDKHAWFQDVLDNEDSPYKDYFLIEKTDDGSAPNNLRCYTGGPAWTKISGGRWYFHSFAKEQPDLNWENPRLRDDILNMMKYWLGLGVAGFRIDAIGNLKKNKAVFEHGTLEPDGPDGMRNVQEYILMQPGIEQFFAQMKEKVFTPFDAMTVAELSVPYDRLSEFAGENGYFSMVFDFSYTDIDVERRDGYEWKRRWNMGELKEKLLQSQMQLQKYGWGSPYLENHDQPRSVSKYIPRKDMSDTSKKALAMLYFMLRGTPYIYQGQEIGMENCPFGSIDNYRDPVAIERYQDCGNDEEKKMAVLDYLEKRGRDHSRTPMQWDDTDYSGFSEVRPWIMVNPDHKVINVRKELGDDESVLSFYKTMIKLRQKSEYSRILTYGDFQKAEESEDCVIAYFRKLDDRRMLIAVNLSDQEQKMEKIDLSDAKIVLNNYASCGNRLKPYQAILAEY